MFQRLLRSKWGVALKRRFREFAIKEFLMRIPRGMTRSQKQTTPLYVIGEMIGFPIDFR